MYPLNFVGYLHKIYWVFFCHRPDSILGMILNKFLSRIFKGFLFTTLISKCKGVGPWQRCVLSEYSCQSPLMHSLIITIFIHIKAPRMMHFPQGGWGVG